MTIEQLPFDAEPFDTETGNGHLPTTTAEAMRGVLAAGRRRAFVLAGNAVVTIRSSKTQTRFTYRVQISKPKIGQQPVWFVKLLNGADNTSDYTYLGTLFAHGFRTTRASRISSAAPSFVAFEWLSRHWEDARVDVWHEGRCGRCGCTLTVPESIESGIGPTCAGK